MAGQPALGHAALAVLLLRTVLRRDAFQWQRQRMVKPWGGGAGTEDHVEVFGSTIRTSAR